MNSALIIGGDSTIGKALADALSPNVTVYSTSRRADAKIPLDLASDPTTWHALPKVDVAYLCAAMTKLDRCENDPEATERVNVTHMQALAQKLLTQGSFVIFLSSNQVFDGSKAYADVSDTTNPQNAYGRQKAAFEQWLLQQPQTAVLRLSKVIGSRLPLLDSWEKSLRAGESIEAFGDLVFAPLPLECAVQGLVKIGKEKHTGIHHLSGTQDLSYAAIARLLAERIGADRALVKPISAATKNIPPHFLPKHATLKTSLSINVPDAEQVIFKA